jgi:peptidyl-tRNA hydrolase ICT1
VLPDQLSATLISSTRVNSKATLRVPLDALLQHVPTALRRDVARSRYLAARANALVVHADDSRKQADNAHACYRRLYEAVAHAARAALPAEASPEQMQRVKSLQKADNERRLHSKKQQSAKKSSRRARGDD